MGEPSLLTLRTRGPFSLALAAAFGFGPREADRDGALLRLAFCVDGFREHAGVVVREGDRGPVCELHGVRDREAARRQVERILSLDHDGDAWARVGQRDPVIGALQARYRGLRPVLFNSPYEAAAWSIISTRYARPLAARVRARIAAELGQEFDLAGERDGAFPCPERLLELEPTKGLGKQKVERLRELARAAAEGALDVAAARARRGGGDGGAAPTARYRAVLRRTHRRAERGPGRRGPADRAARPPRGGPLVSARASAERGEVRGAGRALAALSHLGGRSAAVRLGAGSGPLRDAPGRA